MTAPPDMTGKVIVITGATSGIGEVAAKTLAGAGARIVIVARDKARGEATLAALQGEGHSAHYADLSRLAEMKRVSAEILAANPRIDVLMNNAGAMFTRRAQTADGLEMTFAVNHMAYFVVTALLLPALKAAPGARIVSTASAAHQRARLDFADLQSQRGYNGWAAYGRSKLCNILFTKALASRLAGAGVTATCHHPGFVATRFGDSSGGLLQMALSAAKLGAISPEQGARTMVWLASAPELAGKSGGYYDRRAEAAPSPAAENREDAARLWAESEKLALN